VHLAKTLHLSTVAEGIETFDQCGPLRDSGCQLGQGYYFAKPLTSTDAENLLFGAGAAQNIGMTDGVLPRAS
jgi:EAL domain-containing protein (putative c-di-GMP-specific phosphodiesterase class I)